MQGLRISDLRPNLAPDSAWPRPFAWLGNLAPIFSPNGAPSAPQRRYALFLGQTLFTPKNLRLKPPDPRDRPYAGWAYLRASLLPESGGRQPGDLDVDLRVLRPPARR